MLAPDSNADPSHSDAAVIDVGSNSVRLVLYRLDGRAVWTVFNEKVLAGLGRELSTTGRLSPAGVETAMIALKRFRALIDANRPARVFAAATAAVREAIDGPAFSARVEAETGLRLRVLTGAQEARYAALGVLAGAPSSAGLVGDLGGASLELTPLARGEPEAGVTLPLGPFSFTESGRSDAGRIRSALAKHLRPLGSSYRTETLNAVGGAWRNLALLHMRLSHYPLEIVHQYQITRTDALEAARFISRQSRASLEGIQGISRRRVDALPHAALVLEGLIENLGIQRVVVSAYGLREGLLWEAMAPDLRARDPLVDSCAALGSRYSVAEALGGALQTWLSPSFATLAPLFGARDPILLAAAARLAELGAQLHPDHRADLIFHQVLRAPIPGMDHVERAYLACAAYARHTADATPPDVGTITRLLSPERLQRARALGAALRLGCDLSGRSPDLLARTSIEFRSNAVVLRADEGWAQTLLVDQTAKRAATLATLLGRSAKLRGRRPRPPQIESEAELAEVF